MCVGRRGRQPGKGVDGGVDIVVFGHAVVPKYRLVVRSENDDENPP
jgi:hypothetical protein